MSGDGVSGLDDENDADGNVVSAADLVRNFTHWRTAAHAGPVFITTRRHTTHVLLAANAYERLGGAQSAGGPESDELVDLADWIDEALLVCDAELRIVHANRVTGAITRKPVHAMIGAPLLSALPEIAGSLMETHARRTALAGEPSAVDIPSPFAQGSWLRLQCFPLGPRNVLMFRDVTEDIQRHRLADVKAAILDAMAVHGAVGYIRVSVRGTIERADQPICEILQLPEPRLIGVPVSDLIVVSDKVSFREQLEGVLRGNGSRKLTARLMANDGRQSAFVIGIVQLQGAYGAEGAVMVLTRIESDDDRING